MPPASKVAYSRSRVFLKGVIFFNLIYNNVVLFGVYIDKVKKDNYLLFYLFRKNTFIFKELFPSYTIPIIQEKLISFLCHRASNHSFKNSDGFFFR